MKELWERRGVKVAVIALVVVIVLGLSTVVFGQPGLVSDALGVVTSPLKSGLTSLTGWFGELYSYMFEFDTLKDENGALRAKLAEMEATIFEIEETQEENERFRELLGFAQKNTDYDLEPVSVIARTSSSWSSAFTVSKGTSSGLEAGQCVITEKGEVVGFVVEAGTTWATVITLIDTDFSVGATMSASGESGVAEGDFSLMTEGLLMLSYLPDDAEIVTGDTVLTSGIGGLCPRGLLIGHIVDVRPKAGGMSAYAVVRPSADLDDLKQVFVIKSFEVTE